MKFRVLVLTALMSAPVACAEDPPTDQVPAATTVRVVTHDSFSASDSVLEAFAEKTGITVEVIPSGDAGEVVNKAVLTKGEPLGDVLFGIDNTFLSRALEADIFVPYESPASVYVPDEFELDRENRVTPVDHGEVCVNYDLEFYGAGRVPAPAGLDDLVAPAYRGQLVVQNPATSSPGLSFLLATIARYGEPGWEDYWRGLRANEVEIAAGWEEAYNGMFSGGAGQGDRPMVVSYASSPPAEVHFSGDPATVATTTALEDGCFRQIEFAGILRGTEVTDEAEEVIDFFLSEAFQADLPLNMFVFPVREGIQLPAVFQEYAARPDQVLTMAPGRINDNRDRWIERWTELMTG